MKNMFIKFVFLLLYYFIIYFKLDNINHWKNNSIVLIVIICWRLNNFTVIICVVPGENPQPIASLYETFSHNVVSSTPRLSEVRTHNYHTIMTAPAMYMKTVLFYNWSIFNSFHNKITWIASDCFLTSSEQPVFALTTIGHIAKF
jgi:hypothetical protein